VVSESAATLAATFAAFWLCVVPAAALPNPSAVGAQQFSIDDYFSLKRITEVALSSDAQWLAYAVETYSGDSKTRERRVHVRHLGSPEATESAPQVLADATQIAWIPKRSELAFLADRSGTTQVFSYDAAAGEFRQRTRSADDVERFRYAPDGVNLAYVSRPRSDIGESLFSQFRHGTQGIVVDPRSTSSHDFLNPAWHGMVKTPPPALWVESRSGTFRADLPGEPADSEQGLFWSSDSKRLSITYIAADVPASQLRDQRTSVGVLDIRSRRFHDVARAVAPVTGKPALNFTGGEWLPDRAALLLRRVTETDPWVSDSFPDWAIAPVQRAAALPDSAWRPIETYPTGLRFHATGNSRILVENTVRGVHSLYRLDDAGLHRDAGVAGLEGSSSLFRFSEDFRQAVFVNQSLIRPPEIYALADGKPARQLTQLNAAVRDKVGFSSREVTWNSADGLAIAGWLLEPAGVRPSAGWPLITHIHGGPAFPYPNSFAPYFAYWPYPLEAYAAHGIAVFMPNYRGTHSYGRQIATSTSDQAIGDIVTGVKNLIDSGIADAKRLGISGHSHGAIVGPLAMARAKFFAAASFAEGVANAIVMYEMMSEDANRQIHDATLGASLYQEPQRYLAESPDLQFDGVTSASLFEGGSDAAALLMLGFPKAARRVGMPTEFILYPRTGHNLVIPSLQREAAERNLDWFTFWLLGRVDATPSKASQYVRWRGLR
jgi:dipeptidyl aminopeptidase/acylaminoacyl peptidase